MASAATTGLEQRQQARAISRRLGSRRPGSRRSSCSRHRLGAPAARACRPRGSCAMPPVARPSQVASREVPQHGSGAAHGRSSRRRARPGNRHNAARRQRRRGAQPRREVAVLEIAELARADRRQARDQHELVGRRQLHHLARRQQRPRRLLPADHDMARARARAGGRHSCACARCSVAVPSASEMRLRRALVVGGEGDPHMAIVEDRIVLAIGLVDLVEVWAIRKARTP